MNETEIFLAHFFHILYYDKIKLLKVSETFEKLRVRVRVVLLLERRISII